MRLPLIAATLSVCSLAMADDQPSNAPKTTEKTTDAKQAKLEQKFIDTLTGATMVGHYTLSDRPSDELAKDRYPISKVTKHKDGYWVIVARIQYKQHDIPIAIPVEVQWADDTPVIMITDAKIPVLGKYTARVVVYGDRYAGTWSGAGHGGHLFGKIVREKKPRK